MKSRRLNTLVLTIFLSSSTFVFAETIILKSGEIIKGDLIEKTGKYIKIYVEGVPWTYFFDEIESIDGKPAPIAEESPSNLKAYLVQKGYLKENENIEDMDWNKMDEATKVKVYQQMRTEDLIKLFKGAEEKQLTPSVYMQNAMKESYNLWKEEKSICEEWVKRGNDPIWANQEMAKTSLSHIYIAATCFFVNYEKIYGRYPKSLHELISTYPMYIDNIFDDSEKKPELFGYRYDYTSLEEKKFSLSAEAIVKGKTGNTYLNIDESGVIIEKE